MAQVPTYGAPQVRSNNFNNNVSNAISTEAATRPGRSLQATSNQINQVAQKEFARNMEAIQAANRTRVNDGFNQTKTFEQELEAEVDQIRGVDALQRESGKPLADEYVDKYRKRVANIADGLGNGAQREAYMQKAEEMITNFRGRVTAHEGKEYQSYALSVHEATIKNAVNEIGLKFRDPSAVTASSDAIKSAAYEAARMQGKSKALADESAKEILSKAHVTAISAALQDNDVKFADAYLKKHAKSMTADDILKADKVVSGQLDSTIAFETADKIMRDALRKMDTSDSDRAFNLTGSEKPEERDTFNGFLHEFQGNVPQSYAAFKSSPEAVKEAIKESEKDGAYWLDKMPKATREYVEKNMQSFNNGGGTFQRPTAMELKERAREEIGANNPNRLKMAYDEIDRRYKDQTEAIKQRDERTVAQAMQGVIDNGGSFSALPAEVRAAIPAKEVGGVMDFARKVAEGDNVTDLATYNQLTSNPAIMGQMTDDQFLMLRKKLSNADFKHFSKERADMLSGATKNGPQDLDSASIKRVLDDRLRMLKIDPTPKDESNDAVQVGAIRKFINQSVAAQQQAIGRKMNDVEIEQFIDGLFARTSSRDLWFGDDTFPALGLTANQIPDETYSAIVRAYEARGIAKPSETQILEAFWRGIMRGK